MADVLGAPVHQLDNCDYTVSVGAGLLAFERLGDLGFDDIGAWCAPAGCSTRIRATPPPTTCSTSSS